MDRIFEHSRDLHVRNYVVYSGSDGYAYADAEKTEQITASRLADAFKKGLLVEDGGKFYVPTAMVYEDGVTTITYVKADSSTQTTAVLTLASSIDYPLEALLETLTIGTLTLTPTFDGDVFTYTASTTGASAIVTAVATDPDASIVIRNGSTVVANGAAATWTVGANVVTITVTNGEADNVYTVTVTKTLSDTLASLVLGELVLSPAFGSGTTSYTAETTDVSNVITAVATDPAATIAILHGETPVDNGAAITWEAGANTVTVAVTNGTTKTYTLTVTKS